MTCIENAVNAWWDLLTLKGSKRASSALQAIRRHLVAHLNQESPLQFWLQQQGQLDRIDYRAPEPVTYSSATFRRRKAKTGGFSSLDDAETGGQARHAAQCHEIR